MRENSLNSYVRAKKKYRKEISVEQYIKDNIINRDFSTTKINEKVFTDITEIHTNLGKFYLSAIIDPHDNCVLAPIIARTQTKKLVLRTLQKFVEQQKIVHNQTIIHSDRGSQYTSLKYQKTLNYFGLTHSMSRPGKCPDNSPIESFWATLKQEAFKQVDLKFNNDQEVIDYILGYIKSYNTDRPRTINKIVTREVF